LDTRTKIVPRAEAARIASAGAIVVSGYFDPLVARHAERLADLKNSGAKLLVVVRDPERPVLPRAARAELVAGLTIVDFVTEDTDGIHPQFCLEQEHAHMFEDLVAHVHARQRTASQ
jgi:bifunctional ADP-heptose synthase (sugar kinase/adenylyltransferase)